MKRIQNAKETDKRFTKQEQKNQKKRKLGDQYWNRRILAKSDAAVVMTAVFAGGIFKSSRFRFQELPVIKQKIIVLFRI